MKLLTNILAIYRPPELKVKDFLNELEQLLLENEKEGNKTILIGDINIDILEATKIAHKYILLMHAYGFISYINIPTRIMNNQKSCIDHIFF